MAVKLEVVMEIPGKDPRTFHYEFDQDVITLGRDEHNDIQIPLSTVSRSHATIHQEAGEWYIEDLKSTHGTKHNGKVLGQGGKKLLRPGDVIEVVHFRITFLLTETDFDDVPSQEHTEALARRMVEEVLATIGTDSETPYLRVMNGPDEGKKYDVGPDVAEAVIGRGVDCDFQINDANISRNHAVVRRDWRDITIEDCGSKNGVVINDRRITRPTSLRDADEIVLGAVRLTFIDPSAKFLGKLDDIPAFADDTEMVSDEGEPVASEDEPQDAPPAPVLGEQDPPAPEPHADVPPEGMEPPMGDDGGEMPPPEGAEGEEGTILGEDEDQGPPPARPTKGGLGAVEITLLVGIALVGIALVVGVLVLFVFGD